MKILLSTKTPALTDKDIFPLKYMFLIYIEIIAPHLPLGRVGNL